VELPPNVTVLTKAVAEALPSTGVYIVVLAIPGRPPEPPWLATAVAAIGGELTPSIKSLLTRAQRKELRAYRRYDAAVVAARHVFATLALKYAAEKRLAFYLVDANQNAKWRAFAGAEASASRGLALVAWRPGSSRRRYCRIMGDVGDDATGGDVHDIAATRMDLLLSGGTPGDRWYEGTLLPLDQ
jgi:hypothetical protein